MTQRRDKGQRATATSGKPVARRASGPRLHTGASFTPHGIGSKRDRLRAAAIARRRRTRRRRLLIGIPAAVVVIALAVVGIIYANQKPSVTVTGAFDRAPKVTIPGIKPPATLRVTDLIKGHGARVTRGDLAVVNLVGYSWSGAKHKRVVSSFSSGQPEALTIGQTIPGLDKSLAGQRAGSRLLLSIPPKDGFGSTGNQQLGVTGSDTLVFVVDVLGGYPKTAAAHGTQEPAGDPKLPSVSAPAVGAAPAVKIPKAAPSGTLQATTLIRGTGPRVAKGKLLVAQYEGLIWRNSKVFDSSWQRGAPAAFVIGTGKVIPGWDKGLVGQRIGSRVLLVIPPKDGYGAQGNSQAGIKATDTLVFVVDILGNY
ncbi:MAG: FKBP-type peptidyl-prolyl cis-trans isomerase [Micromonosporaceae bacterium]